MTIHEKDEEDVKRQLNKIVEQQMDNNTALSLHKQKEEAFFAIDKQSEKMFDRLYESWEKDRDVMQFLEQSRTEYTEIRRKIYHQLENNKQALLQERQSLHNAENDLFNGRR